MRNEDLLRKVKNLMALAGSNPTTPEQKEAYRKAMQLLNRVKHAPETPLLTSSAPAIRKPFLSDWLSFFKKPQTVAWAEFFKTEAAPYVTLQIKPDSSIRNWRAEDITKAISDMFRLPIDRITRDGARIRYRVQERAVFEIVAEKGQIAFYLSVPENIAPLIRRRLESVWDNATIEIAKDYSPDMDRDKTAVYELVNKYHDMFSLATDAKSNMPLNSLMDSLQLVGSDEKARVFTYMDPLNQTAHQADLKAAWTKLRSGNRPVKMDFSLRNTFYFVSLGITALLREVVTGVGSLVGGDESENAYAKVASDPMATKQGIDSLTNETKQKQSKAGIKTSVWVAAEANNDSRADLLARSVAGSYGDIAGDNELTARPLKGKKKTEVLRVMKDKQAPKINISYNVFSTAEAANFVKVAGRELQEKYPNIICINQKEVTIDKALTMGGIYLGNVTHKGETFNFYMPTKDHNLLCLPHIVIGGMGSGKTMGFGANAIVEAVRAGYGALAIDPAIGQIGDEVEKTLKPEQVERYDLGKVPFALDFCEVLHSERGRNRLANTIISFFNSVTDEAGAQTGRYIRACVFAMKTGRLKEIITILEDEKYRKQCIKDMPEGMHKLTLQQFDRESPARRNQIVSPVYNRLDAILGDEFLSECLESENSLDMVKIISQKKAFIFDVKKDDLGAEGVDIVVNLLSLKIDLAMSARPKYMGVNPEDAHPFFIVFDEPHQFLKSAGIWKAAAVESRKWRLKYIWLFHEWKQIDKDLRAIIKSALPHYTLYPSSKATFEGMKEEIYPFSVEDGLKLKRYHAINILRAGENGITTPIIAKMACPPSER